MLNACTRTQVHRHKLHRTCARLLLVLALCCFLLFQAEAHIRPVLLTVVQYESKRYALHAFNDAVAENIADDPDAYQKLYSVSYAQDGSIAAVQANTYMMNRLSSALVEILEKKLNRMEDEPLNVPSGTLLGIQMFAGRGPVLHLRVLPESFVAAQVYDKLESSGINQTVMSVYVHFYMNMSVILSGYSTTVTAENDICLSQILLVGNTPQSYWGQSEKENASSSSVQILPFSCQ